MGSAYNTHGEKRNTTCRRFVGKQESWRPRETPRRSWEDNIRTDLQKQNGVLEIRLFRIRRRYQWRDLVNAVMNFQALEQLSDLQLLKDDSAPWSHSVNFIKFKKIFSKLPQGTELLNLANISWLFFLEGFTQRRPQEQLPRNNLPTGPIL